MHITANYVTAILVRADMLRQFGSGQICYSNSGQGSYVTAIHVTAKCVTVINYTTNCFKKCLDHDTRNTINSTKRTQHWPV